MPRTYRSPNLFEIKGNLARLLASENLIVEHRDVEVAYFNMEERRLVLPIYNGLSNTVYDLLVGHEVGHALYTPADIMTRDTTVPKDYINVVEDARIEKLICKEYPGLRRSFANGYKELSEVTDAFKVQVDKIDEYSLLDRINIYFKAGNTYSIPFTDEEVELVKKVSSCSTSDDVINVARQICDYENRRTISKEEPGTTKPENTQQGEGGDTEQNVSNPTTANSLREQDQGSSSHSSSSEGEQKNVEEFEDEENESVIESNHGGDSGGVSQTQKNFDEALRNKLNTGSGSPEYVEIPEINLDHFVVSWKDFFKHMKGMKLDSVGVQYFTNTLLEHQKKSKKEVNYLFKEFEMRKSADMYSRSSSARTGVLDCNKMHTFKYNDDIFKKVTVVPEGKNHGMIFILDWSGSMDNFLLESVKQLFNIVWFCKKAQIKFEVFAFGNCFDSSKKNMVKTEEYSRDTMFDVTDCQLVNMISSSMSNKDMNLGFSYLWSLASMNDRISRRSAHSKGVSLSNHPVPNGYDLQGTPLNEAIVFSRFVVDKFIKDYKIQKTTFVTFTDGESNWATSWVDLNRKYPDNNPGLYQSYIGTNTVEGSQLRDRKLGRVYVPFEEDGADNKPTAIFLQNLKDHHPDVNVIGFRIGDAHDFNYDLNRSNITMNKTDVYRKEYQNNSCCGIPVSGYDMKFHIKDKFLTKQVKLANQSLSQVYNNGDDNIDSAFMKQMETRSKTRFILRSFAEMVS